MNFILKADKLICEKSSNYDKIIKYYQKAIPVLNEEQQLEVYKKLLSCFQIIHSSYDIANCWYHISMLSRKFDYSETEHLYKITIQHYLSLNQFLAGNIYIELGEYYEEKNKILEACDCYHHVAEIFYPKNIYAYYFYSLKKCDLFAFYNYFEEAIYNYEKLFTFISQDNDMNHYCNFVLLKCYLCKIIMNETFEMSEEFKKSKEYQILQEHKPIDDWFEHMFKIIKNKNGFH
jgi:hypothetical protein